jgi:hypothetical protein
MPEEMITRDAPRRTARREVEVRLLMGTPPEPEAVRHLDADGAAEDRRPVGVQGMVGRHLEQVAAEAVTGEGGDFDRLRRCGPGDAQGQQDGECGEHARAPRAHAPS